MNRHTYNERDERSRPYDEGHYGPPSTYGTQSGWQREPERYSDWRGPAPRREESPRDYDEWRNAARDEPRYTREAQQRWGAERGYGRSSRTDLPQDTSDYDWPRRNEPGRGGDPRGEGTSRESSWYRGGDRWQGGQREDVSRWESEGGNVPGTGEVYERGPYGNGYGRSFGGDSFGSGAFGSAYGSGSSARGSYGGYREGGQGGYGSYGNYGSSGRYERDNDMRRAASGAVYGPSGGGYAEGRQGASSYGSGAQRSWEGESYAGRGPKGFRRTDERIRETVSERLEQSDDVDASEIEVAVKEGDVTLTGSVPTRWMKRCAEDCVEALPGVKDVTNQLRVQPRQGKRDSQGTSSSSEQGERASSGYASSGTSTTYGGGSTESKTGNAKGARSN